MEGTMRSVWIALGVATALAAGGGNAYAQLTYKCKNAAGVLEYSDKPCPTTADPVPWRPKYTNEGERLAKQPEKTGETAAGKSAPPPARKSAYTRWLDSQEEAEAEK